MASHRSVLNLSNGFYFRYKYALRAIEACSVKWVVEGESVRNLTIAEAIQARNEQARLREPLPYAELPGRKFEPPASGVAATRREGSLIWAARHYMMTVAEL